MGVLDDAIKEHLELKRKHGVPEEELQRQEEEALGPARRDVAQQPEDDTELEPGQPVTAEAEGDGALVATEPEEPAAVEETAVVEATPPPEHEPHVVEQETALFDMEQATEERPVPPAPLEASVPEETAVHEPVEPTPVEPPPVEPPPVAEESSVVDEPPVVEELQSHDEEPVGEPGHEPDPDDRLGETQPHGFDAVEEDEAAEEDEPPEPAEGEEDVLASDPEDEELDVLEDTPDFLQETPEHDRLWFEQKPPRDFDFD